MGQEEVDAERLAAAQELARRLLISFVDELQDRGFWALQNRERNMLPLETLRGDLEHSPELAGRVVARCRHVEGLLG